MGKQQRFAHRQGITHHENLIDQFDRLAGTLSANQDDVFAHGLEYRQGPIEVGFVSSHHDTERPFGGTFATTTDGGIEHAGTFGAYLTGQFDGGLWADGAHVND